MGVDSLLPIVSFVVPVLNDARKLDRCLASVLEQDYPTDLIEVLVADGGSTDGSRQIADEYSPRMDVKVLDNSSRQQAAWGKALAIGHARGEIVQLMDADVWLTSPSMLRRLVDPMIKDRELGGTIAPYAFVPSLSVWTRFLSCDEFQCDPLVQVLTPPISHFIRGRRPDYALCEFSGTRIPPIGQTTTYWRADIDLDRWGGLFVEDDMPLSLIERGRNRFAFVADVGFGHEHAETLRDLVRKRVRNLRGMDSSWLLQRESRRFAWIDPGDRRHVWTVARWIVGTHLVLPRLVEGIRDAVRLRRWEALLRPLVALAVTDALLAAILGSSEGRVLLREALQGQTRQ